MNGAELSWYGSADPDMAPSNHPTPLCEACARGDERIVSLLVHFGASLTLQGHKEQTPLLAAALNGHDHVLAILLRAGLPRVHADAVQREIARIRESYAVRAARSRAERRAKKAIAGDQDEADADEDGDADAEEEEEDLGGDDELAIEDAGQDDGKSSSQRRTATSGPATSPVAADSTRSPKQPAAGGFAASLPARIRAAAVSSQLTTTLPGGRGRPAFTVILRGGPTAADLFNPSGGRGLDSIVDTAAEDARTTAVIADASTAASGDGAGGEGSLLPAAALLALTAGAGRFAAPATQPAAAGAVIGTSSSRNEMLQEWLSRRSAAFGGDEAATGPGSMSRISAIPALRRVLGMVQAQQAAERAARAAAELPSTLTIRVEGEDADLLARCAYSELSSDSIASQADWDLRVE